MLIRLLQSRYYWLIPVLSWLFLTFASLVWNFSLIDNSVKDIAFERGRVMYEMVRLTKINPVLMANDPTVLKKQVMEDITYSVVSAQPMNPENMAEPWEIAALTRFESGTEYVFQGYLKKEPGYFRFMGPVFMQEQCLQCHGYEGKIVGDVRGGISVKVMAQPILDSQYQYKQMMIFIHVTGFFLISLTSVFLIHQLRSQFQTLNRTKDELRVKEQFLSDVTNSMSEGFAVLDRQGTVRYANPESEWLLGWNTAEMEGQRFSELVHCGRNPDRVNTVESAIELTLQDGLTRTGFDDVFCHKEGREVDIAYSVSPLLREDDDMGVVVTFSDISERKRADEERRSLERQLNQTHKMEAVGQLAGGIAHEINTPIQYVGDNLRFIKESQEDMESLLKVYSNLMQKASALPELEVEVAKVKETIEEIDLAYLEEETSNAIEQSITGASQVARIVLAMKEFAHPGSKQMALADLNRIISNAIAVCKNEWKYVADTELKLGESLPQVKCLGGEISQVVLNLVINAAHAIEAAKLQQKGKISITTTFNDDYVEMSIADTGTGIPKEVQEHVFNPFFTTKDIGSGTGQGLAIAQDIVVVKHQGELFFETEEGKGTRFVMRLPLNINPE
ncbi:ATP-binding protein [Candidatus Thiodiazotropha sp. CDECU1]|uniref:ATP-binding protein n=1 Tax=Candidatus Thiodiazotropha sp. CDECU1 TaxID=3065865 RepID=UPI002931E245|nr:ATP-binding protein [Candidatus Thiodiazotropha sp. CDECU1]